MDLKLVFGAALAGAMISLPASAVMINESEPNNDLANADLLLRSDLLQAAVGVFDLSSGPTAGDVDVFRIDLLSGDFLSAITFPIENPPDDPDTELILLDATGLVLVVEDDIESTLGSGLNYQAAGNETVYLAVTGFDDFDGMIGDPGFSAGSESDEFIDGFFGPADPVTENGAYILTVSVVPEPATAVMLGVAGLCGLRRRA